MVVLHEIVIKFGARQRTGILVLNVGNNVSMLEGNQTNTLFGFRCSRDLRHYWHCHSSNITCDTRTDDREEIPIA